MRFPAAAALCGWLAACTSDSKSTHAWFAMDTDFSAALHGRGRVPARAAFDALEAESARLERIFSDFLPGSDLEKITGREGDTLPVGPELAAVLAEARRTYLESQGTLDVTLRRLKAAWGLASGDSARVPSEAEIEAAMAGNPLFGAPDTPGVAALPPWGIPPYEILPGGRLVLLRDSLSLDLGGIAKGYAVDRMHALLDSLGFPVHLVQAGGDMRLGGRKEGKPWRIGIRHPRRPDTVGGYLTLDRPRAVSTSGDYERFFIRDSVRHHHIFDPRTGRPARPWSAVTVLAATGLEADALTKPLFILGPEKSPPLLASRGAEALWVREAAGIPGGLCAVASPGMAGGLSHAFPACP